MPNMVCIPDADIIECDNSNHLFGITVVISNFKITLSRFTYPSICAGDFSSHHSFYRYINEYANGEALTMYNGPNYLTCPYCSMQKIEVPSTRRDSKEARTQIFASFPVPTSPLSYSTSLLDDFPNIQHRLDCKTFGIKQMTVYPLHPPLYHQTNTALFVFLILHLVSKEVHPQRLNMHSDVAWDQLLSPYPSWSTIYELKVSFEGDILRHIPFPKYLYIDFWKPHQQHRSKDQD